MTVVTPTLRNGKLGEICIHVLKPTLRQQYAFQEAASVRKLCFILIAFQWQTDELQKPKAIHERCHRGGDLDLVHVSSLPGCLLHTPDFSID